MSKLTPKQAIVMGVFTALIGTPVALFGIWWGVQSFALLVGAERTAGTVVAVNVRSQAGSGTTRVLPVVEYEVDGREYAVEGRVGVSILGRKRKGDRVQVFYRSDQPADGQLNTFSDRWACPLFFGGLGGLFAAIGVYMVRYQVRRA